jgi:thioredoxin-related protein
MIKNKNPHHALMVGTASCWVCEGWKEEIFQVKKISSM